MCMSGQLRTGVSAIPGVLRFVGDLAHNVDWFIHTWDWSQQKPSHACRDYPRRQTTPGMIHRMIEAYQPRAIRVDDHDGMMDGLGMPCDAGRGQWIGVHLCDEMRRTWCRENGTRHDVVIRLRPDMTYARRNTLASWVTLVQDAPAHVLWSAIADGSRVDDVLWAARPETMTRTAGFWTRMQGRGHDSIPAGEFIEHLATQGIEPREGAQSPYDRVYAPIREESQEMDPVTEVGRIYATDLLLYSDFQRNDLGEKISTEEWIQLRSDWINEL